MQSSSRTYPEQSSGLRDDSDNTSTGEQWDNTKSNQGKWEHREDNTAGMGGYTYASQDLGQSGYRDTGGRTGTGPGGVSDQYATSGQYGGPDTTTSSHTAGYAGYMDPRIAGAGGRQPEYDDEYSGAVGAGGGQMGKPSMTSRVKGAAEKIAGKITGDPVKEARGREREEGTF